ncbi:MAG: LysR family transcriptional regulator [Myxococcales bacterium]|nr:LysR family transcriptional regulator [Myxococcales bacterium]
MDKLAAMRTFVVIQDRGSLTAAAEALHKSLPTVVRTLAELERSLGVVLLRRTTRSMSLTEEGRLYLDRCRAILADVEEAEALMASGRREPHGRLRVTAPVLFGRMHVAPPVVDFVARHPHVEVQLLLLDRVVNLVEEGIDVAVRIGPLVDSALIATRLGDMRRVVVAAPKLLRRTKVPKHPRELAERDCVWVTGITGPDWRFREGGRLRNRGKERSQPVRSRLSFNDAGAALDACIRGAGFGLFLAYQVAPAVKAKQLRIVLEPFELPPVPVSLLYPAARVLSASLRAFVDWMKAPLRASTSVR